MSGLGTDYSIIYECRCIQTMCRDFPLYCDLNHRFDKIKMMKKIFGDDSNFIEYRHIRSKEGYDITKIIHCVKCREKK